MYIASVSVKLKRIFAKHKIQVHSSSTESIPDCGQFPLVSQCTCLAVLPCFRPCSRSGPPHLFSPHWYLSLGSAVSVFFCCKNETVPLLFVWIIGDYCSSKCQDLKSSLQDLTQRVSQTSHTYQPQTASPLSGVR